MRPRPEPPVCIVQADELRAAVGFEDLLDPIARGLAESSAGRADNGLIVMLPAGRPELGDVYVKTGTLLGHPAYMVKISPWFPTNRDTGLPQGGFVAVFDSQTGHTIALLADEHYLSDVRTAATGALAARALAPIQVDTAAVLGAGVQAFWQARALYRERRFTELVVWARDHTRAAELADRLRPLLLGATVCVGTDIETTVRRADVLITATASRTPLVRGAWLHPGQHITAIGADDPSKCELDALTLRRARVFVDDLTINIANGDIHHAIEEGRYAASEIAGELGAVLAGRMSGRQSEQDITVAKFIGIGAADLVTAETALTRLGLINGAR